MELSWVVIGYCGDSIDVGYLEEFIVVGFYFGMDWFGVDVILLF